MYDLRTGDIVECVDDQPRHAERPVMPRRGGLYTVAALRAGDAGALVRLKELQPACACGGCGWEAWRFRRVHRPTGELIAGIRAALWPETV